MNTVFTAAVFTGLSNNKTSAFTEVKVLMLGRCDRFEMEPD